MEMLICTELSGLRSCAGAWHRVRRRAQSTAACLALCAQDPLKEAWQGKGLEICLSWGGVREGSCSRCPPTHLCMELGGL